MAGTHLKPSGSASSTKKEEGPGSGLNTVSVPPQFQPIFDKAKDFVAQYFRDRVEDPEKSTISISGERYILVRAASMSVEFFDLVTSLYKDKDEEEARSVASNLLFDLAHAIGKADAKSFHSRTGVSDPIEKLSAGPVHFSYSGWAYVEILPESAPTPDETFYLIYNHPFSFESDSWIKHGRKVDHPVCIMNAGYSSGWCEESFGFPLVSSEVECQAMGDAHCRFIMAPPARIEEHIHNYLEHNKSAKPRQRGSDRSAPVAVPEFFQRKRLEDAMRTVNQKLESRVEERTAELTRAYDRLMQEASDREKAERLQSALLQIASQATSDQDLQQVYAQIHGIIGGLMYAKNCYIALFDPATQVVSFPYHVDEKDPRPEPRVGGRALTEYVLRTGHPLLATPERLEELAQQGEIARMGTHSLDWMGVPLKNDETTFGVLVVQSYRENVRYGAAEEKILTFVSQQIARAIEHKRNQEAIRESESKFRALAESAVPAIYIFNSNRMLYVNPATENIFGYSQSEMLQMDPLQIIHPDYRDLMATRAQDRIEGRLAPTRYEFKALTKNGDVRWLDVSASAIVFEGQTAVVATAVDVTERKRAEALQSALYRIAEKASSAEDLKEFYRAIHQIVGELMYAENFFIALYDANNKTLTFPYAVDEKDTFPDPETPVSLGHSLTEYVLRTGQPLFVTPEEFKKMVERGDVRVIGSDSLDWIGVPLKESNESFGVIVVQSYRESVRFTEKDKEILNFVSQQVASAIKHKRSQIALRSSEERYRELFENANDMIMTFDLEGKVTSINASALQATGYSLEEMLNHNVFQLAVPEQREKVKDILQRKLNGEKATIYEIGVLAKDGSRITLEIAIRLMLKDGKPAGIQGIGRDTTERRQLEDRLRQSQKMEAVGRLAGGVAHDFNNLLTVIQGYTEMLLNNLNPVDPMRSEVTEIKKAADRAAALTGQLLTFSRQQVLAPKIMDMNHVVANMDSLLQRLLGEDIGFVTILAPHLGRIKADSGQMEQVIMNLAVNARDAMPSGGKLTIETANAELDEQFVADHLGMTPGSYVLLIVKDTGHGMDENTRAHIFEPFFTTKEQGRGTGLGLSTVYGVVRQSGGHIHVESTPERGSTFRVYFPCVEGTEEIAKAVVQAHNQVVHGNETVLLVEDEDGVRSLVRHVLQRKGYTVLEAAEGDQALRVCRDHKAKIHLLLTDVVLKTISGRELSQQLVALRPEMKVIYMSGYTDDEVVHRGVFSQNTAFLQKPFTTQAVVEKVREVLDQV